MPQAKLLDYGKNSQSCDACGEPLYLVQYELYADSGHFLEMMWMVGCLTCCVSRQSRLEDSDLQDELRGVLPVTFSLCGRVVWAGSHYIFTLEEVLMELGSSKECIGCKTNSHVLVENRAGSPIFYRSCACGNVLLQGEELREVSEQYERLSRIAEKTAKVRGPW